MNNVKVPVRYVGTKAQKRDNVAGTKAVWTPGSVVDCPSDVAQRLFRHPMVWRPADVPFALEVMPSGNSASDLVRLLELLEAGRFVEALALRPSLERMFSYEPPRQVTRVAGDNRLAHESAVEIVSEVLEVDYVKESQKESKGQTAKTNPADAPKEGAGLQDKSTMLSEYLKRPAPEIVAEVPQMKPALVAQLLSAERKAKQPRVTVLRALEQAGGE